MASAMRRIALITGGSRGVGAATALAFAQRGHDVVITYRNKATRAQEVVAEATARGVRALALASDMTQTEQIDQVFTRVRSWAGRLDVLVLNASGGLERDLVAADPEYPLRLNRDAQLAMIDGSLPLLNPDSTIVFVTSHWAHLYGAVEQLPAYEPVAASKHAGEIAIRARQEDLSARGIRLLIVTGDLVEGTITPKLLARTAAGRWQHHHQPATPLPTTADMGEAVAAAATDPTLPSGHTIVVGRPLESL
jgi:NAD(P)-dependent dehydrogenase (short-subunit alcohol dehydrogenase family)